jgi:dTDP-4-dehydrorhamnose reductase
MARPVIVTGAAGQLGRALVQVFESEAPVVALGHGDLDVTSGRAVDQVIGELMPSVILNCASYNDVDAAETHPVDALDVNAFAVHALARAARATGALLVHYSTDFVFDGTGHEPASEQDEPNPQSVYAASKLLGEWFALEAPGAYVLRVESLFGADPALGGRSSLDKIVAGIARGDEVVVFSDRTVSPSYVHDVAAATRLIVRQRPAAGLYHCVNSGAATWETIAREAARQLGRTARLKPVTMAEVSMAAARPTYCALSNTKLAAAGIPMPRWEDALGRTIASSR